MRLLIADESKPRAIPPTNTGEFIHEAKRVKINNYLTEAVAGKIIRDFARAKNARRVLIEIDCKGGILLFAGTIMEQIYDLQEGGTEVRMLVSGACHSAAVAIFMAVPPELRYAQQQAHFMIHSANFFTDYPLSPSQREEIEYRNLYQLLQPIVRGTRITQASLETLLASRKAAFLSPQAALDLNLISGIV